MHLYNSVVQSHKLLWINTHFSLHNGAVGRIWYAHTKHYKMGTGRKRLEKTAENKEKPLDRGWVMGQRCAHVKPQMSVLERQMTLYKPSTALKAINNAKNMNLTKFPRRLLTRKQTRRPDNKGWLGNWPLHKVPFVRQLSLFYQAENDSCWTVRCAGARLIAPGRRCN